MNSLKILVIFALVGSTFAGGDTRCAILKTKFSELLQASEIMVEKELDTLAEVADLFPLMVRSQIIQYYCRLNVTRNIIATATSILTGSSFDYIFNILNGTIQPPFEDPLDCIELELMSFIDFDENIQQNEIVLAESKAQTSIINDSLPCPEIKAYLAPYATSTQIIARNSTKDTTENTRNFESIGFRDVFTQFYPGIMQCNRENIINAVAEIYNMNTSVILDYLANTTQPAPYVLSCISETLDNINDANDFINRLNDTVNNGSNNTIDCSDIQDKFLKFSTVWTTYVNGLQSILSNMSNTNPVLIPVFIDDYLSDMDIMVDFMANYTASILNVSSEAVRDILLSKMSIPNEYPYSCLNELIFTRNTVSALLGITVSGIRNLAQNSTVNATTCLERYEILKSQIGLLTQWENSKINLVKNSLSSFGTLNMTNSFLDLFIMCNKTLSQKHTILGDFIGTVLNTDATSVAQYLDCNSDPLDEQFECISFLIEIFDGLMQQGLTSINTRSFQNLVVSSIPDFGAQSQCDS